MLPAGNQPATARLPPSVQTPSLHCDPHDDRHLLARNAGSLLPLKWLQLKLPSKYRAHLPIDALAHSMLFLLGPESDQPLPITSQYHLLNSYPEQPRCPSYPQLKQKGCDLLMEEWRSATPHPAKYRYPLSLTLYPFIGLNKFDAGRIHQMMSGKSYLKAHPSWDITEPNTCQRYGEAPEPFDHTIIHCPANRPARDHHLQGASNLTPDAPIWSSVALLRALSSFIRTTNTAFPRRCLTAPAQPPCQLAHMSPLWFPLVTLCRVREDRFLYLFFILGMFVLRVNLGEGFLGLLCLIFAPVCGPVTGTDPPLKKNANGLFICLFVLDLRFCFRRC